MTATTTLPVSRQALIDAMAADLVRFEAHACEADAIRALYGCRSYTIFDIMVLVDDARQTAVQTIIGREMSHG
jgi:hypothetical protein